MSRISCIFIAFVSVFSSCVFDNEELGVIPGDQADVIRLILRENGYNVSDDEAADDYLEFSSTNEHVENKDKYWLLLPAKSQRYIMLSDHINRLNTDMFIGVKSYSSASKVNLQENNLVDSICIQTDSKVNIPKLFLSINNIRSLPINIGSLRVGTLDLKFNQLTNLPSEIMGMTTDPLHYGYFFIDVNYNNLDVARLDTAIVHWLDNFSNKDWRETQVR